MPKRVMRFSCAVEFSVPRLGELSVDCPVAVSLYAGEFPATPTAPVMIAPRPWRNLRRLRPRLSGEGVIRGERLRYLGDRAKLRPCRTIMLTLRTAPWPPAGLWSQNP